MADYGVKVSKKSINVKSATNDNLVYKSSVGSSRIQKAINGTIIVPAGLSSATLSITHGLSYTPVVYVAVKMNEMMPTPSWGTDYISSTYYVNNSSVVIVVKTAGVFITYGAVVDANICIMLDRLK